MPGASIGGRNWICRSRASAPIMNHLALRTPARSSSCMSLDVHVARIFDDAEPSRFGSGWLSGTASVFLGTLGLGAVACFYWPELLTSPDVRARLPIPLIRTLVQLVIGLAFLLGLISTMLRRRKVLGITGMALALAASLAGGGNVPVEGAVQATPVYLGLDWFLLNALLLA